MKRGFKHAGKYYVYIVESSSGAAYAGHTKDLGAGLRLYNSRSGAKASKVRGRVKLVYAKEYRNYEDALHAEIGLKKLRKPQRQELIKSYEKGEEVRFSKNPKISFCTTCMGRLNHLQETFFKNLEDNSDYPDADFVILNYNSPDRLEDWVRDNMSGLIASGKVRYYKTEDPVYYHMAHAKNIVHKLATGDIVCNVDADNFTGKGFARYLADVFCEKSRRFVHGHWALRRGTTGRIAVLKKYFISVGGYDEHLKGWGGDDDDIMRRFSILGLEDYMIRDTSFLETVEHDKKESVKYMSRKFQDYRLSLKSNKKLSLRSSRFLRFRANCNRHWGCARVQKNLEGKIFEV